MVFVKKMCPNMSSVYIALFSFTATILLKDVFCCDEEYRLVRHLMDRYDASVRPVENSSLPLLVTFGVSLHHIIDVEEKDQLLTTNCWITQIWTDFHLRWNVSEFNGISVIRIPYERVWKPDIILYNNADPNYRSAVINTNVIVAHTGEVTWLSHGIYVSVCDINVEQFPFDVQLCKMKWASWTYDGFQDMQNMLDSSVNGVVYVSFGTNVYTSLMAPELIETFLKAFESLPYDVLWKFDSEVLPRKVKNVHVRKWFPQRDLLVHPKVKAFVFQGGLQSLDEAIASKVPVVGIPFLGDQAFNLELCAKLGIGVKLDTLTFTSDDLLQAVNVVINQASYRQNLEIVTKYIYDQPQSPLERAVWWVNYVLRHKGAKHLRSPAANVTWSEYLMIDVALIIIGVFFTLLASVAVVVKQVRNMCKGDNNKLKRN